MILYRNHMKNSSNVALEQHTGWYSAAATNLKECVCHTDIGYSPWQVQSKPLHYSKTVYVIGVVLFVVCQRTLFSVAQHPAMITQLKEHSHMWPGPLQNVVWEITSLYTLIASWLWSHLHCCPLATEWEGIFLLRSCFETWFYKDKPRIILFNHDPYFLWRLSVSAVALYQPACRSMATFHCCLNTFQTLTGNPFSISSHNGTSSNHRRPHYVPLLASFVTNHLF